MDSCSGGTSKMGRFRASHAFFSCLSLQVISMSVRLSEWSKRTHLSTLASNSAILASCSRLRGFGFSTAGGFGTSSRANQSENSGFVPNSLSSWSCIARAVNLSACLRHPRFRCMMAHSPPRTALLPRLPCGGLSLSARSPHQVSSCLIRRGSSIPSSICL